MDIFQLLGILVGAISGVTWEFLGTTPHKNIPTFTPSLIINLFGKTLHLHHYLLYLAVLIILGIYAVKTNRIFHPSVLMIFFFILAAIIYNFLKFRDWYVFLK